jgi:hypothetical protein
MACGLRNHVAGAVALGTSDVRDAHADDVDGGPAAPPPSPSREADGPVALKAMLPSTNRYASSLQRNAAMPVAVTNTTARA